ncbi:MAG: 50S ribosomal protein L21 [Bacilli bacterium]
MRAIIENGGKQYAVEQGTILYLEKINAAEGEVVTFDKVLSVDNNFGKPYVSGATVIAEVIKHGKQRKITIFKYTQKSRSTRKKQGHRQPYTSVKITEIKA